MDVITDITATKADGMIHEMEMFVIDTMFRIDEAITAALTFEPHIDASIFDVPHSVEDSDDDEEDYDEAAEDSLEDDDEYACRMAMQGFSQVQQTLADALHTRVAQRIREKAGMNRKLADQLWQAVVNVEQSF